MPPSIQTTTFMPSSFSSTTTSSDSNAEHRAAERTTSSDVAAGDGATCGTRGYFGGTLMRTPRVPARASRRAHLDVGHARRARLCLGEDRHVASADALGCHVGQRRAVGEWFRPLGGVRATGHLDCD